MAAKKKTKSKKPAAKSRTAKRVPAKVKARPARRAAPARSTARPKAAPANPLRELARRIVDLTVRHDDDAVLALYADNVESQEMNMPPSSGIEAIKQKFAMWRGMVTDSSWTAANVWVDGNTIIIEWVGRVTLASSGRQVDLREVAIHEIENGKIVRERFYYDPAKLQP